MGKRSSHSTLALRLAETGCSGTDERWSPLAGPDAGREQHYLRRVRPQSDGQRRLMEAIERYHLTIALGPAGTGKTYLAVSAAVAALEAGEVGRIVLTRPAVEAGENLGYLPGDIGEKLAPYLRPLDDAQNCTYGQIKMMLTRLGWHSTMVVTGDPDQSGLLDGLSGLAQIARRLDAIAQVAVIRLGEGDIVRHPLVGEMLTVL